MKRAIVFALLAVAAAAPATASAQFSLGARVAYAMPFGDLQGPDTPGDPSTSLGDVVSSAIPIQVDALYRVSPQFSVGAYFSYAFAQAKFEIPGIPVTCDTSGVDCSGSQMRFGIQGAYAFKAGGFEPWVGAMIGYEILDVTLSLSGVGDVDASVKGFEWFTLQGGADWNLSKTFVLGPFVAFGFGQYTDRRFEVPGDPAVDESIPEKAFHEWLSLGVRGRFDL